MQVQVCLEVGPKVAGAFVPDCPGCWVFGRDQDAVLNRAKTAVTEWHSWIRAHGESVASPSIITIDPVEIIHVSYNPAAAGKPEPLFWSEVYPVSVKDINRTLRLMEYARNDLLELCSGLRRDALRWKPKTEPRSIANSLRHIAVVEWWYLTRLNIELPREFPRDLFQLLRYTRELAERSLGRLSKQERSEIVQPKSDLSPVCNLWTARKVLRRFVDHERLHTNYIRKLIRLYQSNEVAFSR